MAELHLDTKELAARWRVRKETLANWRHKGRGPKYIKLTERKVLYPVAEVEKWERDHRRASTAK